MPGVVWDLINEAAQPVISAIITSLIQPLLSISPSSLLLSQPSLFPASRTLFANKHSSLVLPPSLSRSYFIFVLLFLSLFHSFLLPSLSFFPTQHLCPSPMWISRQMSEFFSLVVHWANVPGGRPSDLSSEQLSRALRGQ